METDSVPKQLNISVNILKTLWLGSVRLNFQAFLAANKVLLTFIEKKTNKIGNGKCS